MIKSGYNDPAKSKCLRPVLSHLNIILHLPTFVYLVHVVQGKVNVVESFNACLSFCTLLQSLVSLIMLPSSHDQCLMYLAHGCDNYFFTGDAGLSDVDLLPSHLSHYARNQLLFSPEVLTNKKRIVHYFKL